MRRAVVAVGCSIATAACGGGGSGGPGTPSGIGASTGSGFGSTGTPIAQTYRSTGLAAQGRVFVHLFEWRWTDIAQECESWLGPNGFDAVQVSPPNEHAVINGYPWWQRYQPVSYKLDQSRSGTLTEFNAMVARCHAVGVKIYVDAVINHMAVDLGINSSGVGSAGSAYAKYSYPAVPYASADFHLPACAVTNYQDAANVQLCELVGLPDLKTEADTVRQKIANYLIGLNASGVDGFRIDAAKHMAPADLDAILGQVNAAAKTAGRALPYVFLEVIDNAGEAVKATDYFGVGYASGGAVDLTEFQYGYKVSDAFLARNGVSLGDLQTLAASLLPADKTVVFPDNHDNQRANNIYFGDGPRYELAQIYTLAQPVGVASVMSSYGFDRTTQAGRDTGPPSNPPGQTQSTFNNSVSVCTTALNAPQSGAWVCEHRRIAIANMVTFRKTVAGVPVSNWVTFNADQIAFARQGKGFVALNRAATPSAVQVMQTTLPAGRYCNVAAGTVDVAGKLCGGGALDVASDGTVSAAIPATGAIALHIGAKIN